MLHARLARSSFWLKVAAAVLLAFLAERLLFDQEVGATIGAHALAWTACVVALRPALLRDRRALFAIVAAVGFGLVMVERPGPLACLLFAVSLTVAVLSARVKSGDPAWRWAQRFVVHGVVMTVGWALDLFKVNTLPARTVRAVRRSPWALLGVIALPVIGGGIFLALFAAANPLISDFLARLRLPELPEHAFARFIFFGACAVAVASTLRPRWRRKLFELPSLPARALPGGGVASVTLSLLVFNLLFAIQNALDIAFLWSGAPLPGDMGLADYAHRGAWALMVTALLAGLFVLVFLRPGSETARKPLVKGLVVAWIGQNMLLVASSILRTADYVEAYALTRFRIAALLWMALVGIGLLLICWRLLRNRDGHWLIDANVRVLLVVLAVVSVVDFGSIAAWWNVRHAREVGGRGVELDLGYLRSLDSSALVSLVELERALPDSAFRDRVAAVRREIHVDVRNRRSDWRGWTWRDARRLNRVAELAADRPLVQPRPGPREWDGTLEVVPPPPVAPRAVPFAIPAPPAPTAPPLTSAPGV